MKEIAIEDKKRSPISWVPTLYFAMGLPFVMINMAATVMFRNLEISDAQIAFWTSLIMLPWTLKPLWSPFLEMYKTKKFFVILTQTLTGLMFGLTALALNLPHFFAICIAILAVVALSGATHDIAADGVYMSALSKDDQAKYIGWQGAFYNIAKLVAQGGLVYVSGVLIKYFAGNIDGVTPFIQASSEHQAAVIAWMGILLFAGALMFAFGLYHIKFLPSEQKNENKEANVKGDKGRTRRDIHRFVPQTPHRLLHLLHHPLSFRRRICDEDSTTLPHGRPRKPGSWTH